MFGIGFVNNVVLKYEYNQKHKIVINSDSVDNFVINKEINEENTSLLTSDIYEYCE